MPISVALGAPGVLDLRSALRQAKGDVLLVKRQAAERTLERLKTAIEGAIASEGLHFTGRLGSSWRTEMLAGGEAVGSSVIARVGSSKSGAAATDLGVKPGFWLSFTALRTWLVAHSGGLKLFLTKRGKAVSSGRNLSSSLKSRLRAKTSDAAAAEARRQTWALMTWFQKQGIKARDYISGPAEQMPRLMVEETERGLDDALMRWVQTV